MKNVRIKLVVAVAAACVLIAIGSVASARGSGKFEGHLTSYQEVPALSTPGAGDFRARLDKDGQSMTYELTFGGTESTVTQSHIHFENATNNGPVVVFLCTNLGNGPAGTQACPTGGGTITGTIRAADVGGGAAGQGLAAGEFDEFVRALRSGATYVNVHSTNRPTGEIRAQIGDDDRGDD